MVLELLAVHQVSKQTSPANLGRAIKVRSTIAIEKLHEARHPRSWLEEAHWRPCADFQGRRRCCCPLRRCDLRFDVLLCGGQRPCSFEEALLL